MSAMGQRTILADSRCPLKSRAASPVIAIFVIRITRIAIFVIRITVGRKAPTYTLCIDSRLEAPMSDSFINQTSRVAIAGRAAEHHRPWNELTLRGDYHPPFGRIEARTEAAKWLCLV